MRKLLLLLAIAISIHSYSQNETHDPILIENGFSASGAMNMYWETTDLDDAGKADEGARWHLEQMNDTISFWIDVPPLGLYHLSKKQWIKGDACAIYQKIAGFRTYVIFDVRFKHIQIFEYDKNKWMVQICSIPISEQ